MSTYKRKSGLTLVEIIIVVAIIAILASMVVTVATRIDNKAKEQLTKSTMTIIDSALGQFADYGYQYKGIDYTTLDFPVDFNDFPVNDIEGVLTDALDRVVVVTGQHDPNYSGIETMYFLLSQVPDSRKTLEQIDNALKTNLGYDNQPMNITITGKIYPLFRILDGWGNTLRYDYYIDENDYYALYGGNWSDFLADRVSMKRTFPMTISAGPDGVFGTADDIKSR